MWSCAVVVTSVQNIFNRCTLRLVGSAKNSHIHNNDRRARAGGDCISKGNYQRSWTPREFDERKQKARVFESAEEMSFVLRGHCLWVQYRIECIGSATVKPGRDVRSRFWVSTWTVQSGTNVDQKGCDFLHETTFTHHKWSDQGRIGSSILGGFQNVQIHISFELIDTTLHKSVGINVGAPEPCNQGVGRRNNLIRKHQRFHFNLALLGSDQPRRGQFSQIHQDLE